ncbi:hypothetical protein [Methylobacterium sp. CM6244]
MALKAPRSTDAKPVSAPLTASVPLDVPPVVPAPFQQVPREVTGVMEEMRDFARRQTVDINSIAE